MIRLILYVHIFFFLNTAVSGLEAQGLNRFESVQSQMGTTFKIILYSNDSLVAQRAFSECWSRLDELNTTFSDYLEYSETTLLTNKAGSGEWSSVSDDMWHILKIAHSISESTEGSFDVTLGNLTKLWRRAIRHNELPSEQEVKIAKQNSSYRFIEFHEVDQKIRLQSSGVRFDFGGIAKGFAVDEIYEILQNYGLEYAVVDGGGDLYIGPNPAGMPEWKISFFHYPQSKMELENRGIASSGSLYKNVQFNDHKFSHIIEPTTGMGVRSSILEDEIVNVVAPNCTLADALATALSSTDRTNRDAIIKKYPNCSYFISYKNHKE